MSETEPPDDALEEFSLLRERLKSGVRRVMEINRKHPHYVAAVIMAIGCEAVGRLLTAMDGERREPHDIFVKELVRQYKRLDDEMGQDLFDAIRNGIAHRFRTKPIELKDGRQIRVIVNWGEGRPHFGVRHDPAGVYVNLFRMQRDFEAMLDRHRADLVRTSRPGRQLAELWYRDRRAVTFAKDSDREWQRFLSEEEA